MGFGFIWVILSSFNYNLHIFVNEIFPLLKYMDIGQKLYHINSWYFLVCAIFLSTFLVPSIFHSQSRVKVAFLRFFISQQIGSIWIKCYINSTKQSFKPSQSRSFTLIHKQESQIELNNISPPWQNLQRTKVHEIPRIHGKNWANKYKFLTNLHLSEISLKTRMSLSTKSKLEPNQKNKVHNT